MRNLFVLISIPLFLTTLAAADGYLLAVSNEKSNDVTIIDGPSGKVLGTVAASPRPRGIHPSPDGNFVYVALSGTAPEGPPADRAKPATPPPPAAPRPPTKKNRGG